MERRRMKIGLLVDLEVEKPQEDVIHSENLLVPLVFVKNWIFFGFENVKVNTPQEIFLQTPPLI